jgi:hypothetical protein
MENTTITSGQIVSGAFTDKQNADRAYAALKERGYSSDQIHLFMSEDSSKKYLSHDVVKSGTKTMAGTGTGAVIGGAAGAIAAAIAAVGSNLLIPGLGLVIAGPLVAALAGAGAGGVSGGILGALVGTGIPEEKAIIYEKNVTSGNIVLGVHAHNNGEAAEIENELLRHGAHDIHR